MRKIKLKTITIGDEKYPIYCDLFVLNRIQDEFNMSVNQFERDLIGADVVRDDEGKPKLDDNNKIILKPANINIRTLMLALYLMVDEGLTIESEQSGKEYEEVTQSYLARICDLPYTELSSVLHEEFNRCFSRKKKS